MLSREQAVEIKVLARRGLGVREIARQTGISRNTVRRYLRDEQAGHYKPREPRATKLEPFKGYVLERVAAARPHWIPATVLLRELREAGYEGGISQLKAFLEDVMNFAADKARCRDENPQALSERCKRRRMVVRSAVSGAGA
ncbi:helix-turn-helix domain-containing protein, partial [Burkholderia ubonensis]|uniref:helix-turn-helix domain-containing protein n=2 Tax=Burkholderia ubonensis TaxID=101571 RepID=UPI001E427E39